MKAEVALQVICWIIVAAAVASFIGHLLGASGEPSDEWHKGSQD